MCRCGLVSRLCTLAVLFSLLLYTSACAMTICWITDGRYEFSEAVPQMYFFNTKTQKLETRKLSFENVRLVQGEYSGMPIVASYDPNAGTHLYACPYDALSAKSLPFILFSKINLGGDKLYAYYDNMLYIVEDSNPSDYFPHILDIAVIDSSNKTNMGHAPEWWNPWKMEAYPVAMCNKSGAIAFWDAKMDTYGIHIMNGTSETIESRYIPVFLSEMEIIPPLSFADEEHIAYGIIEDGINGKSYLNIQLVDLIQESSQTICSTLWLRKEECILSLLCMRNEREIYLMTGVPKTGAPDGFYDTLYLLRLNLHSDGSSELNELLHFDHQSQRSSLNYISPLFAIFCG